MIPVWWAYADFGKFSMHHCFRSSPYEVTAHHAQPSSLEVSKSLWPKRRTFTVLAAMAACVLLLSACVATLPAETSEAVATGAVQNERLESIADYTLPTPEPLITAEVSAVISTEGSRANIRSGPSLDAPIVAKANPGDTYSVTGQSPEGDWWQICCVRGPADAEGEATEPAWISSAVADLDGNADAIPVIAPLLPDDVQATWQVDWTCGSERCEVRECSATIQAAANGTTDEQWLQVEHDVTWADSCFEPDNWVFEVDRFTGKERSGEYVDNFLYNYWLGVQPGPATNVYTLADGRKVAVWCAGPHEFELEESGGWTTVYAGSTCHDVRTGELVSLNYTKRWLYTGEYEGQQYERAYFGDYETLDQYLLDTNVELFFVEE